MTAVEARQTFTPAKDATRTARVGWLGVLLAVAVVVLGVLCVREALVADGRIDARPWLAPAVDDLDGVGPSVGLAVLGVVVALVGLWLVGLAFGRRPRTRLAVASAASGPGARSGVTIGVGDAARLARVAAADVDDVLEARASATRRRVTVTVTSHEGVDVRPQVEAAVREQLAPLAEPMAVKVVARYRAGLRAEGLPG